MLTTTTKQLVPTNFLLLYFLLNNEFLSDLIIDVIETL